MPCKNLFKRFARCSFLGNFFPIINRQPTLFIRLTYFLLVPETKEHITVIYTHYKMHKFVEMVNELQNEKNLQLFGLR